MAKRAPRRYPYPYGVVFEAVTAAPPDAGGNYEVVAHDLEAGAVDVDGWFRWWTWGEYISLRVAPEDPTWTRVDVKVEHKVMFDLSSRRRAIRAIFATLDAALPGGEDVDPLSDVSPTAIDDEQTDPNARWQLDPIGDHELRYWDGRHFTEHVADGGVRSTDAAPGLTAD